MRGAAAASAGSMATASSTVFTRAIEAVAPHESGRLAGRLEFRALRVVLEDAARRLLVGDARLGAQRLEHAPAVQRHGEDLRGVLARAPRGAFVEEAQAPRPLRRVRPEAKEERRILPQEPARDLERRARIGPRLGVGHGDLAAVGEGGLEARAVAALDDLHLVARLRQVPGAGGPDHAGAEDDDFHFPSREPENGQGERNAASLRFSPCPLLLPGVGAEYREMA